MRHQHQQAAGDGDIGGQARALVADGVLQDLHQHLLALADAVIDAGHAALSTGIVEPHELAQALGLAHAEEARARQADIDEGGLHAGEHAFDAADHQIADEAGAGSACRTGAVGAVVHAAFDHQIAQHTFINERNTRFADTDIDENFVAHGRAGDSNCGFATSLGCKRRKKPAAPRIPWPRVPASVLILRRIPPRAAGRGFPPAAGRQPRYRSR